MRGFRTYWAFYLRFLKYWADHLIIHHVITILLSVVDAGITHVVLYCFSCSASTRRGTPIPETRPTRRRYQPVLRNEFGKLVDFPAVMGFYSLATDNNFCFQERDGKTHIRLYLVACAIFQFITKCRQEVHFNVGFYNTTKQMLTWYSTVANRTAIICQ